MLAPPYLAGYVLEGLLSVLGGSAMKRFIPLLFITLFFYNLALAGESVRSIVVLEGTPLCLVANEAMVAGDKGLSITFTKFSKSLAAMISEAKIVPDSLTKFALHSVVVEMPKEKVRLLDFVEGVISYEPVKKVKIAVVGEPRRISRDDASVLLDRSVNHIGANVLHDRGLRGDGIRIAIVDTGIDWTHRDLGGGLGEGYKVEKAIHAVSPKAFPMDDNGHGTHVSGIAAGLKGVAPGARLWGIKVLNKDGVGYTDWILKGIERALDFDLDPSTFDDQADVMNLSLGGDDGDPYDAMSMALSNAMIAGVVVAVAAGNSGPKFLTVGTPGTSRYAITVGASTLEDTRASFSSAGPVIQNSSVKPDIMAPGFEITSTIPDDKYATWSGTSMAAPHIAGAAALVKEMLIKSGASSISAFKIKSLLLLAAKDLNLDMFYQGYGRAKLDAVDKVPVIFDNTTLAFGQWRGGKKGPDYTATQRLVFENISSTQLKVSLSEGSGGDWKKGALFVSTPEELELVVGGGSDLILDLFAKSGMGSPGGTGAFRLPIIIETDSGWSRGIPLCIARMK